MDAQQAFDKFIAGLITLVELIAVLDSENMASDRHTWTVQRFKDEYHLFRDNLMISEGIRHDRKKE